MPLTKKGKKIMRSMKKQYGKKRGEQVFYATKNKGKIKGVKKSVMAKIAQVLTRPAPEYDLPTAEAQVRDLDAIVEKLNTTFQQELKDEVEAENFFLN